MTGEDGYVESMREILFSNDNIFSILMICIFQ